MYSGRRVGPGLPGRVATVSVHTSPLEQPGTGDAGGMNVYIIEVAKRLARLNVAVEIFTRATSSELPPVIEPTPGVLVRHVVAGPYEGLAKEDLPAQLCAFTTGVLRAEARKDAGWYDLIHSHYWLSGQVGWLAKDRWGVPLVHSAHTLGRVKNAALAVGDQPEPKARLLGEDQVVAEADRLVASTPEEARQLVDLYGADRDRVAVVEPGADLDTFVPLAARRRKAVRRSLGLRSDAVVLLFVGRIQPLKAPDVLLRAAARLLDPTGPDHDPDLARRLVVVVCGGPSGSGLDQPQHLQALARDLGIADRVSFLPPRPAGELALLYAAADVVAVPSHSESFGLVAVEAQATGTPVVASAVGGLVTAVSDGVSGLLVPGHDPGLWAKALAAAVARRARLSTGAVAHARAFSWQRTAEGLVRIYRDALAERRALAELAL